MLVKGCVPVIPSADLEKSLRFWLGVRIGQKHRFLASLGMTRALGR